MGRRARPVRLTAQDRRVLQGWVRSGRTEQRKVERAKIVLLCAEGVTNLEVARRLGFRLARVSKWRSRFAAHGIRGLEDEPRSGRRRSYGEEMERRVLEQIKKSPPPGQKRWDGRSIARALGIQSPHFVWRVLRKHQIAFTQRGKRKRSQ